MNESESGKNESQDSKQSAMLNPRTLAMLAVVAAGLLLVNALGPSNQNPQNSTPGSLPALPHLPGTSLPTSGIPSLPRGMPGTIDKAGQVVDKAVDAADTAVSTMHSVMNTAANTVQSMIDRPIVKSDSQDLVDADAKPEVQQ